MVIMSATFAVLPCQSTLSDEQATTSVGLPSSRPNIVLMLADDMGYGDLGCMGSEHLETPHIDALAESGVLCTHAYVASSVCSPSRAGLLTGRDPRRFGYEGNLNQGAANYATRPELLGLPPGEHTLGDHLRADGYATALIGKWHLGTGDGFHPNDRGFDHFCGMLVGSHSYFPQPDRNQLERNGQPLREFSSPYLTDFFTDEAIDWIRKQESNTEQKPWFLFASWNAPHGPLQATEADLKRFDHIDNKRRRTYAAMMYALDRGVGRIRSQLQAGGQLNNTLICFFSDNGGATGNASWNGPLSGVKGCLREGGVRIPMIWSWPDQLPAGETYAGVVSSLDLLPTFMTAAGGQPLPLSPPRAHEDRNNRQKSVKAYGAYDGSNVLSQLTDTSPPESRTLFWRLQGQTAVLDGSDKLIRLSHRPAQMFRPDVDQAESVDRMATDPVRAAELFQMLGRWEASLTTVPLWGSSPYWTGQSAKHYDMWPVRPEPE
ncbi:MAG: sulfatase-like hydrolase/transferase [Fuerstiella sp.]|jgi:arylsulfatase B|nr:sulfatase-like hydrolase/transferase [Fuerstiella sp.]MCP4513070.1 sulfatase-like hydrolase/transferase [Fuerstiella sp.]MDG2126420.1 sulfatase-like hydrolase/transferase [Fuerstiella sp.]